MTRAVSPEAYEHVTRALVYEEEERWDDAAAELQRALPFDDEAPEVRAHLADLFVRLGRLDDAAEQVEQSLRIEPTVDGWLASAHLREARRRQRRPAGEPAARGRDHAQGRRRRQRRRGGRARLPGAVRRAAGRPGHRRRLRELPPAGRDRARHRPRAFPARGAGLGARCARRGRGGPGRARWRRSRPTSTRGCCWPSCRWRAGRSTPPRPAFARRSIARRRRARSPRRSPAGWCRAATPPTRSSSPNGSPPRGAAPTR